MSEAPASLPLPERYGGWLTDLNNERELASDGTLMEEESQ